MAVKTTVFGYPKIGPQRELKKALESYWNGKISQSELLIEAEKLIVNNARTVSALLPSGMVPSNEFSLYDFILDISVMFDVIPERFRDISDPVDRYFAMARGTSKAPACEMTKWFNTNYHYIVPELNGTVDFKIVENKPLREFRLIKEKLNLQTKPVITGPFTFLKCAKLKGEKFYELLFKIAHVYNQLLNELSQEGVSEIQIDEPAFVLDLTDDEVNKLQECYREITNIENKNTRIYIQTYYESVSNYEKLVYNLPVHGFGLDFIDGEENIDNILKFGFPEDKILIAGVVSGRDPWKTDFNKTMKLIEKLIKFVTLDRLILSNSCPLFHLPVSVKLESGPSEILNLLSFANERIEELTLLREIIDGKEIPVQNLSESRDSGLKEKIEEIDRKDLKRYPEFKERYKKQLRDLALPLFPTTTIGSFPQTKQVRKVRADYKSGKISEQEYEKFIQEEIKNAIKIQEEIGLDVLVHGEFERTDMVEFFAEKLKGFFVTKNGWVQSYGSRCVRPPIIYGDILRTEPLVLKETLYAQSLTKKPVKAILTGPVTMLQWSYPRQIPKREIAYQIAFALQEEVMELEKAGIKIIQIDEPALKEGMPLKKEKVNDYFDWAIKSFKIVTHAVRPETQIHTHMCYSDFNDIIEKIYELDADVISIEASRSKGEILSAFEKFKYDHGIGIGVYDIHSPRIPRVEEILDIIERSIKVIDKSLLWINPDCGLKTRGWEETIPSLKNMVKAALISRKKYEGGKDV